MYSLDGYVEYLIDYFTILFFTFLTPFTLLPLDVWFVLISYEWNDIAFTIITFLTPLGLAVYPFCKFFYGC